MKLKELSKLLGLSQTTVSRALNGYPEVNEATRIRVQQAAKKHNYSPNTRAKGLATGRAHAIGHFIPVSSQHEMVNPIFGDFIAGASECYARNGYELMLTLVPDGNQERNYRELISKGAVDGIIVHGPLTNDRRIPLLNRIGIPYVVHGRSSEATEEYTWVDMNNTHAFARATAFLTDLGHRRIGFINGLEKMDFAHRRRTGYLAGLAESGIDPDPALMHSSEMTEVYGHHRTNEMLALPNPPTAILVSSMITAIGVRRALDENNLKLGKDISVVTHDDDLSYLKNGETVPIFTSTRSSVHNAGRLAAQVLIDTIHNSNPQPTTLLQAELVVGRSTGPAPR